MAKAKIGAALSQGGLSELKRRILVVVIGIFIYRIGAHITVPGLNPQRLADLFHQESGGILGLFNVFSGGALFHLSVFTLGVMPYISSSIIMQLITAVSPKLEQLKKEGESGRRKINQYTRYGTLFLGTFQAIGIAKLLSSQGIVLYPGLYFYFVCTMTLVTGTMFLMWLGEQMTERGVGNGISLIIFAGIVSRFPSAIAQVMGQVRQGQMLAIALMIMVVAVLAVTAFVVFVERGQRRITVNYAKRQHGRHMYAAQSSHLPLKLNMSGVIPPIFASSIILFPAMLVKLFGGNITWLNDIIMMLQPGEPLYMLCFAVAIIFFCFWFTALTFNPKDTANNLKKSGAFIPGIRPGEQTANYIDGVISRLTLSGSIYLTLVALLPEFLIKTWHVPFYFGGTSLLIVVVVLMDFIAQIQAHLMSHQYESIMKRANIKGRNIGLIR